MKSYKYLIIGGGMTADAAVKGIRDVDERGDTALICAEPDPPYQRPPLSKSLWTKDKSIDDIWCGTEEMGAEIFRSRRAVSIDPQNRQVVDDEGSAYRYESLLIATGGTPRRLSAGDVKIIYYRKLRDYQRLRALADVASEFAVLGGGFIGSEISAALQSSGKQVTMIFPEGGINGRLLPAEFARALTRYYEDRGVRVLAGLKPSRIDSGDGAHELLIENGNKVSVDSVVAGLGIDPNTQLAVEAGLEVEDGIVVDEYLRTKDPRIFAAGDVANFYSPALERRLRAEHEDNALTMGKIAGRNMAGEEQAYSHLPFFYSDLFDVGYEAVGVTDSSGEVVSDLKDPEEKGAIFYMKGDRVTGIVFWNMFGKIDAGRDLIAAHGPHTKKELDGWIKELLND